VHSIPLAKVSNRRHFVGHVQAWPTNTVWPDLTDLHGARQKVPILYNGTTIITPKFAPSHGDLNPHLIHGPLGPAKSSIQTASRSVQPFLQGSLVWQTEGRTDHAARSLTIGRIYVRSTTMRSKN